MFSSGVGVVFLKLLESGFQKCWSWSRFFKTAGVGSRSRFFKTAGVGSRSRFFKTAGVGVGILPEFYFNLPTLVSLVSTRY